MSKPALEAVPTKRVTEGHNQHRNPGMPLDMGWVNEVRVNTNRVQKRAAELGTRRTVKKENQAAWLLKAITLMDLTTLSGDDTAGNVKKLCAEARQPLHAETIAQLREAGLDIKTGAVCVYYDKVATAVAALEGTNIPVAAVSTGFPAAQTPFETRLEEIKRSVADGAKEIDIVITREQVLAGQWKTLYDQIKAYREACGDAHLKTILETGELGDETNVAKASRVAMMAGSDFIKTSTGKAGINANLAVSLVMVRQIREYFEKTGEKVGFKPAGGISKTKDALIYMSLMKEELGNEWLEPELFRFGASSLLDDIKRQLIHYSTGHYAGSERLKQQHIEFEAKKLEEIVRVFKTLDYGPAPESDKEALEWLALHENKFGHYIGGAFIKGESDKAIDVTCPADGRKLAQIKEATQEEVDAAVESARAAQEEWAELPARKRKEFLYALARQVQKHSRLFAVLESLDNGKSIRETRDIDVPLVARHLRYHAGMAQILDTKFPGHEPYGVAGQIIPWNFPLLMLAWKVAPALAAGNAVVLKPAEQTPLTAMLFAEICRDAAKETGVPAGIVNIVNGSGKTGAMIVNHEGINKLAFTGSTEVGRIIREASAGSGKGLTLELGGKSPFIVFEDADLDSTVEGVVDAIWFNQGEVCCGGSRLLVQESVYDRFVEKLKARMATLRVGHPLDKSIDMGAVVSPDQQNQISRMVEDARRDGAEVYQFPNACPTNGCYYPPTLITNVDPNDTIMQDEVFGPVIGAISFRTHDEAVKLANETSYGLAASIWSENANKASEVAARIKAGVVWINNTNSFDAASGFGGYKESGYGREGGSEGMLAYLKPAVAKATGSADVGTVQRNYNGVAASPVDQTPKLYVGGKQARPDSGYSLPVVSPKGEKIGEVGKGNRKDIRNAVEAAQGAASWAKVPGDTKSQILDFMAENLSKRADEFATRLQDMTGCTLGAAQEEVEASIEALFNAAAWADKFEGFVHEPPSKNLVLTLQEPVGVVGISCPNEKPLLSFVTMVAGAIAAGNRVVVTPSEKYPLAATDFYQVLDTSDVPPGVVNIVTGDRDELAKTLAQHEAVDAMWYHGSQKGSAMVEQEAARSNLKQTWTNAGKAYDWEELGSALGMKDVIFPKGKQVKAIWVPYGEGVGPS